jgi:8-oxo-dGTP diphosphatase
MTTTVLLVRHAHAGVRGAWPGDDLDRPLSEQGRGQAAAISRCWSDRAVTAVHSSRAVRCVATVQPLAEARGLAVQDAPALLEGTPAATTLGWLERLEGDVVVACSHGDVIGNVIGRLHDRGTDLDGAQRWPKASTWELTVRDGLVAHGRLHPPPAGHA